MFNWHGQIELDRLSAIGITIVIATVVYVTLCRRRDVKISTVDVASFASHFGGFLAAAWMIVESICNIGKPPSHWRIYVVILSLGLAYYCFDKWYEMLPRSAPTTIVTQELEAPSVEPPRAKKSTTRRFVRFGISVLVAVVLLVLGMVVGQRFLKSTTGSPVPITKTAFNGK